MNLRYKMKSENESETELCAKFTPWLLSKAKVARAQDQQRPLTVPLPRNDPYAS